MYEYYNSIMEYCYHINYVVQAIVGPRIMEIVYAEVYTTSVPQWFRNRSTRPHVNNNIMRTRLFHS